MRVARYARQLGRAIARRRISRKERKYREVLDATFEEFKKWSIRHENGRYRGLSTLFNIGLYLLIANKDIQALKLDALTHPDVWTRKLHARIILLTILEWDADKVSGKKFKEALDLMAIPAYLRLEAVDVLRELRQIQRKANSQFTHIRNTAIAHRDADALLQYRAIRDLKEWEVWELAAEFFAAVEKFILVHTKILGASQTLQSYIRQWSDSEKRQSQPQDVRGELAP
ncbi:hypothetical protein [Rhizomicrobium electricum]|uniref:HEPN AbiU2-like domain-containing protein n=1 Tax=Rhizomicrobium electricum TaxID=480070 RepID=A0ABN1EMM9_9PROT|nr:hypothetical protein [Rhizomicrobium electricum]NIJ46929.1 hypothetical protein [Rhizomicrobium electricum]